MNFKLDILMESMTRITDTRGDQPESSGDTFWRAL